MNSLHLFLAFFLIILSLSVQAQTPSFTLLSPDQKTKVQVEVGPTVQYRVSYDGKEILAPSPISMTLADGKVLGANARVASQKASPTVNREVKPLYGIQSTYRDHYNELTLTFKDKFALVFRAYDNGVAYRFQTSLPGTITVKSEQATFRFTEDYPAYFHPVQGLINSNESFYDRRIISAFDSASRISTPPVLVDVPSGPKVVVLESDLLDYPGLNLAVEKGAPHSLTGVFAAYPKKVRPGGHMNFNIWVDEREDYIARTSGTRSFPWRALALAASDKDLLTNQLVYLLASDNKIGDASWVKPGKVAWDWWNSLNLTGVPFKTGFNTDTYKYFIDFASANGIEYVNLDEGWSDQFDLLKVTDKLDMTEVIRYAKSKNVGLILWCVWHTLDKQMQPALDQFAKWGIAGVKVDFMDRDDQVVVNFYERLLREAAKRKMLVNYHGAYKPTGLEKAYPNNINREGVRGLEWNKFSAEGTTPEHAVSIPFIRMVAGPMDYTPGAMNSANKTDFRTVNDRPMSQGTRCQQLAMFAVYYAPLQMLADAPTAYQREPEVLKFLSGIPTVWDQTVAIDGKVAEYVALARRKGNAWYVGAMTDWTPRTLKLKFDFLGAGTYTAEIFSDGPNAERVGSDYTRTTRQVKAGDEITVEMAAGGGWAARITPVK
jgi:alpha-glucosidase